MSSNVTNSVCLPYGFGKVFSQEISEERLVGSHSPPSPIEEVAEAIREALVNPLDFPALNEAIVPDDRVVLAIDQDTPAAEVIVAEVWTILNQRGVAAGDVTIVQPPPACGNNSHDPRCLLSDEVRDLVKWVVHDPEGGDSCSYLASTASGDRLYLAQSVVEADVVIPIGVIGFDPLSGYRGTGSVLFPSLSNRESIEKSRGQGHLELGPDDERPLRQVIDEVSWLLGVQFCLQVLPSTGTSASEFLGGLHESVLRRGKALLTEQWRVSLPERAEIVVVSVDNDAGGHTWNQIGSALATARNLVEPEGKIIVLSEVAAEIGPGMQFVAAAQSASDAIKPLRLEAPADTIAATQLVNAVEWATVYLLSPLAAETLEDLFVTALSSEEEVTKLLAGDESCAFIAHAQHTWGQANSE